MKKSVKIKKTVFLILLVILLSGFFGGLLGFLVGHKALKENNTCSFESQSFSQSGISFSTSSQIDADFSLFWDAWKILKKFYYRRDSLTDKELLYGAISGLTEATHDPYTEFYPPQDAKMFNEDITGKFGGIGAEIGIRNGFLQIISPLKGTPADRIGLKPGDKILKIDGEVTTHMNLFEAVKKIRGPVGKKVTLTIFRDTWKEPKDFTIVRELIDIPASKLTFLDLEGHKVAYLQIYNFNQNLGKDFFKKALRIVFSQTEGIILDLRDNPGGYLDIAVDIAGWFLEKGKVVVKEKFTDRPEVIVKAEGNQLFRKLPVVILVNKGSASASEILAAALKEQRPDVKIIGETTYGKGSVQTLKCLKDGSCLKITIALWLTPKGEEIENKGIKPDIEIKENENALTGTDSDNQFSKAKEVILEEIKSEKEAKTSWDLFKEALPTLKGFKLKIFNSSSTH